MGEYTPRGFDPDDPNWIDYERPYNEGGEWLPAGWTLAYNATGLPERVVPLDDDDV